MATLPSEGIAEYFVPFVFERLMGILVKQFPFYAMIGQVLFKVWVGEESRSPFRVNLCFSYRASRSILPNPRRWNHGQDGLRFRPSANPLTHSLCSSVSGTEKPLAREIIANASSAPMPWDLSRQAATRAEICGNGRPSEANPQQQVLVLKPRSVGQVGDLTQHRLRPLRIPTPSSSSVAAHASAMGSTSVGLPNPIHRAKASLNWLGIP